MSVSVRIKTDPQGAKTAGELLFDKPFYVEMETYNSLDENDLAVRGEFTTGDTRIDRQMAKRPSRVWRSINDLLMLWHDGVEINLINGLRDITTIHEIIQEHLQNCENYHRRMGTSFRREPAATTAERLQDLKSLDEFGRYLYNKVRTHSKGVELTGIDKILADSGDVVGSNIPSTDARAIRNSPDYVGIEERIDYGQLKSRKRWR